MQTAVVGTTIPTGVNSRGRKASSGIPKPALRKMTLEQARLIALGSAMTKDESHPDPILLLFPRTNSVRGRRSRRVTGRRRLRGNRDPVVAAS